MRRTWIGTFGAAGLGLAAVFLGHAVHGQPDLPSSVALPLPVAAPLAPVPAGAPQPLAPVKPPAPVKPVAPLPEIIVPTAFQSAAPLPASPERVVPPETTSTPEARPGKQEPAVSIEWVAPPSVRLNHPLAGQIVVRNNGTATVHNVVVRYRPADGVQVRGSEPQANGAAGELTWSLGTLSAGQVRKVELQLVPQVRGALQCNATVSFTAGAGHEVVVREPLLAVKLQAPDKVVAGETVKLLFTLSNPGDGATDGIKLKAHLPEGLEHSRGRVLEVEAGTLGPKESKTLKLDCVARGSGPQKCLVTASADGNLSATDSAALDILVPRLDLAMSGPRLRYIDRHAVYVLKVSNTGSAPATGVALQAVVPAGFKVHAPGSGGTYDKASGNVVWAVGDLPPGQSREVALDVIPTTPGEHRLAALASSARGLKSGAEVHTHVEGVSHLVIDLHDVDDPVEVGAETVYELRLANNGTRTETNVEVVCALPEQVELKAVKCAEGLRYQVKGRDVVFEPIPRLAKNADVIYHLHVRGKQPGDARLRVRVLADDLREPLTREESTRFYSDDTPVRPTAVAPESR